MVTEYKLSYTAAQIDERLGMVDDMVKTVNGVVPDDKGNVQITLPDADGCMDFVVTVQIDMAGNATTDYWLDDVWKAVSDGKRPRLYCSEVHFPDGVTFWDTWMEPLNAQNGDFYALRMGSDGVIKQYQIMLSPKEFGMVIPSVMVEPIVSLGITGATVGQIAKITAVDENGTPTAWEAVEIPGVGGNVDLTGYATERWVQDNYQPKGEYLTEHQDISGKLDADQLPQAVNDALAEAKESGLFDGAPGDNYVLTDADMQEIAEMAAEMVEIPSPDSSQNANFETDETLTLENGVLSVNTTDRVEQDNTLPITSAGVHATVGNIEALLKTI